MTTVLIVVNIVVAIIAVSYAIMTAMERIALFRENTRRR